MKHDFYMKLIRYTLDNTPLSSTDISSVPLEELYDFASLHKLSPFLVNVLNYYPLTGKYDHEFARFWKEEAANMVFLEYKKFAMTKQLLSLAQKKNLSLIFFKGYILADLYPSFTMRTSSDTDLLVDASSLQAVNALLKELHYTRLSSLDMENVYTYIYREQDYPLHKIELHTSLFEDDCAAQTACLESLQLSAAKKNICISCCGVTVKTLEHTKHLIYQVYHMVKHLCFHGLPVRYLLDTALFVRQYNAQIDWKTFAAAMDTLGYSCFWQCFSTLLIQYFDVPNNICDAPKAKSDTLPHELLVDLLSFGMRSRDKELSHYFFYFERYLEKLIQKDSRGVSTVTFDGTTVPVSVVPLEMQQNSVLQMRICLLQNLQLL